ncbi:hypothetical protein FQZ97_1157060 [compost metagenome]
MACFSLHIWLLLLFAPLIRHFKAAGPDATFFLAGDGLFAAVVAIGDSPALFHHPTVEIGFAKIASTEVASVLIEAFFFAANRGSADSAA